MRQCSRGLDSGGWCGVGCIFTRTAMYHQLLFNILKTKESKRYSNEGFTLVELIVVVVIIGILSAIAVPSFMSSADKAKQKEVTAALGSYIKAVQAYYTENSVFPQNSVQLSEYVAISGCNVTNPTTCKTATPVNHGLAAVTGWNTVSGLYTIRYTPPTGTATVATFEALPAGAFQTTGYGVTACFNSANGVTKVSDATTKGVTIPTAQRATCG